MVLPGNPSTATEDEMATGFTSSTPMTDFSAYSLGYSEGRSTRGAAIAGVTIASFVLLMMIIGASLYGTDDSRCCRRKKNDKGDVVIIAAEK